MEVQGTFNAQRFYDTLALILSRRENVKITVKVTQEPETEVQQKKAVQIIIPDRAYRRE